MKQKLCLFSPRRRVALRLVAASLFAASLLLAALSYAQQPAALRPVPPPGIEVGAADRAELEAGIAALGREIEGLRTALQKRPALLALLPDVQIFHNAARYALSYNEFFKPEEIRTAKAQLQQGLERARELREGRAPWATQTGLVVRGYLSEVDGSVQPYGLVVPPGYRADLPFRHRLDAWFHGRSETLSEVNFLAERQKSPGQFTPPNAFVLHLYGRYCNANKFAGEVDLFEALAHVRANYPIDENRISVRGFSMGGAATWHIAVHHAGLWAAAAPGAGFAETAEYLKLKPEEQPWYQRKLWHLYDATDYALNLFNCPTVAYSGELDRQIQAAQIMDRHLRTEGMELAHIIGPKTEHKYHPDSIREISARIDGIVERGRNPVPRQVRFTTWTLRYNRMLWVTIDAMGEHWERARVDAEIADAATVRLATKNVTALTLEMPAGLCPLDATRRPVAILDEQRVEAAPVKSDRSWTAHFRRIDGRWRAVESSEEPGLRKRHGLQGPIDDAFMSRFIMVRPTGKPMSEALGAWVASEQGRAIAQWRSQFRGEAIVRDDTALTEAEIAASNLVLWGDPSSNAILAKILDRLPIGWTAEGVRVGAQAWSPMHAPILIFPNPLNPRRYVVLNSGITFREADYLTNSRQVARLPDWAVVDLRVPPGPDAPGRIAAAGFFNERWELRAP